VTGAEAGQDRERVRRRLVLVVGTLAGLLVLAGVLPWVTGGDSTIRFLALPMLLAGLMVSGAAIRIATVRRPTPVTPVERTCDGCCCGGGGCGVLGERKAGTGGDAGGEARTDARADAG
jgi:hypothetical protein